MTSLSGLFLGTRRISSDNASNFTSYEFVNWANRFNIVLDNSAAWNPARNMHAETNIKKTKRAIKGLCGSFGMRLDNERVQVRLMAINTTKLRTKTKTGMKGRSTTTT